MNTKNNPSLASQESRLFFHNYSRIPLEISHANECYIYTTGGKQFLDLISGIGVNALGYGNPTILKAITEQAKKYIHVSNLFLAKPQFDLAKSLLSLTGFSKVFFSNSGTESIEGAIKLVRTWGNSHTPKKKTILALTNSFHGRTYGGISLTDKEKYHKGFEPLLPNIDFVSFNDTEDLEKKLTSNVAAIFLEFIQGEGGVYAISHEFANKLAQLKKKHDFLIVADEIQSGFGRTGKFFSYMNYANILPDIICVAKPIGGGLPLGAIIGNDAVSDLFSKGSHGTTFGGNPLACAAGNALLKEILSKNIMENVIETGNYIKEQVLELKTKYIDIVEIRQYGLMIGISMNQNASSFVSQFLEKNIIINVTSENVIRLLPPLILSKNHAKKFIATFKEILQKCYKS